LDFYKFDENKAVKSSVKNQIVFQTEIDISSICHESILAGSSALSENSYKKVYNTFIGCVAHKGDYNYEQYYLFYFETNF